MDWGCNFTQTNQSWGKCNSMKNDWCIGKKIRMRGMKQMKKRIGISFPRRWFIKEGLVPRWYLAPGETWTRDDRVHNSAKGAPGYAFAHLAGRATVVATSGPGRAANCLLRSKSRRSLLSVYDERPAAKSYSSRCACPPGRISPHFATFFDGVCILCALLYGYRYSSFVRIVIHPASGSLLQLHCRASTILYVYTLRNLPLRSTHL